jgi:hypothetical protein
VVRKGKRNSLSLPEIGLFSCESSSRSGNAEEPTGPYARPRAGEDRVGPVVYPVPSACNSDGTMVVHAACSFFLSETSSLLLSVSLFTVRLKSQLDFAFTELARPPICAGPAGVT